MASSIKHLAPSYFAALVFVALSYGCHKLSYAEDLNGVSSTAITKSSTLTKPSSLKKFDKQAQARIKNFKIPPKTTLSLWADHSQTQNPGYFTFDTQGRMLVAEISRIDKGVGDIRAYPEMTVEDILIQSNNDRLRMYQNHTARHPMTYYVGTSDQIRLLEDKDDDGRAESSTIFAGQFDKTLDGLGAGVVERDGKVYYANIPHLWRLQDKNNDGIADTRASLQDGFGIRMSFMGHDMHGLTWGPDGKLYWSIGDRGFSLTTQEGNKIHKPNEGAIFRANADGSQLEVFYSGLRNAQELAFDQFGNLFTADNDSDGDDFERINYIVEGGESGWHAGHQTIINFTTRLDLRSYKYTGDTQLPNAWMTQKLWQTRNPQHAAFILPAIGQIEGGPSGLTFNPSISFGQQWRNTFWLVHYKGSPEQTFISSFRTQEDGAGFTVTEQQEMIKGFNATDLEFGPDGKLYIAEYNTSGWGPQDAGAIYTLQYTGKRDKNKIAVHKALLRAPYTRKTITELRDLLTTDHLAIRMRAQFELAKRGAEGIGTFQQIAVDKNAPLLARLHSIWGLGQIKNETSAHLDILKILEKLLTDHEDQVRIQAARVLGDHKVKSAIPYLIDLLSDKHKRAAMYAAIGLGRMQAKQAVPALIKLAQQNNSHDIFLRHGLVMALKGIDLQHWINYKNHSSAAVRLVVLLALRKMRDPQLAYFLNDQNPQISYEAIASINDLQLTEVHQAAATVLQDFGQTNNSAPASDIEQFIHHRLININFNLGDISSAKRLLDYAAKPKLATRLRSEALAAIEGWTDLNPIDTTTGLPSKHRTTRANITKLIKQYVPKILALAKGQAMLQTMRLAEANNISIDSNLLISITQEKQNPASIRIQALETLVKRKNKKLAAIISKLLVDKHGSVRAKALEALMSIDKTRGLKSAIRFAQAEDTTDHQAGLKILAQVDSSEANKLLEQQLTRLLDGKLNKGVILELLNAVKNRNSPEIKHKLDLYQSRIKRSELIEQYTGSVEGGSRKRGKQLFYSHGAAACMRCHIIDGKGGNVGPNLSYIGSQHGRSYLLQALIEPSAAVASGYGSMTVTPKKGKAVSGIFIKEDEARIILRLSDDQEKTFLKTQLETIDRPLSSMPSMQHILTPYELRDIVAFLANLKYENKKAAH